MRNAEKPQNKSGVTSRFVTTVYFTVLVLSESFHMCGYGMWTQARSHCWSYCKNGELMNLPSVWKWISWRADAFEFLSTVTVCIEHSQ